MTDIVKLLRDKYYIGPHFEDVHRQRIEWRAADEIERLREALGNVSRMKVFPDAQTNQFTLATAIHIARAALGEGK